jgi:hypothetical protein
MPEEHCLGKEVAWKIKTLEVNVPLKTGHHLLKKGQCVKALSFKFKLTSFLRKQESQNLYHKDTKGTK